MLCTTSPARSYVINDNYKELRWQLCKQMILEWQCTSTLIIAVLTIAAIRHWQRGSLLPAMAQSKAQTISISSFWKVAACYREFHKTIQKLATPCNSHHLHQKILSAPSKNKYSKLLLNCCYLFTWFNTLCTCTHNQVVISWRKGWVAHLTFAFMNHSCITEVPLNFPDKARYRQQRELLHFSVSQYGFPLW